MSRDELAPGIFRAPAEWEPHEAVWLQWPSESMRPYTGYQLKLESTWLAMTRAMQSHVEVRIVVEDEPARDRLDAQLRALGIETSNISLHVIPLDDIWARDNGPIFVLDAAGQVAVTHWNFNGWGGRSRFGRDAEVPVRIAKNLDLPIFNAPMIAEGGAIEIDGAGTFMATKSSLVNPNRNPEMDQQAVERVLGEYLGVRQGDHRRALSRAGDRRHPHTHTHRGGRRDPLRHPTSTSRTAAFLNLHGWRFQQPLTPENGSGTLVGPARPANRTGSATLAVLRHQRSLDWSLSCSESERLNSSSYSES